jgi:hypothetical protein
MPNEGEVKQSTYGSFQDGVAPQYRMNRRAEQVVPDYYAQLAMDGRVFAANGGEASTVITFAGVYDADAPDFHLHVPLGTTVIPLRIEVIYEAVGTETTMEIIALASTTGDASVTGTAVTVKPMRIDGPNTSACTATVAVDAAGCTSPYAGTYVEFWKYQRPLTDTVASGENDRLPLVFEWSAAKNVPPVIVGSTVGSCLAVYAASQAGTGFITVTWAEIPTVSVV